MVGCGIDNVRPRLEPLPDLGAFGVDEQALSDVSSGCTYSPTTSVLSFTIGTTPTLMWKGSDGTILVNGYACATATSSNTKKINVTESPANSANTFILDFYGGTFALGTTTDVGISVDLGMNASDKLHLRVTEGNDNVVMGSTGINVNNDTNRDLTTANTEEHIISLGTGNDTFTGAGNTVTGGAGAIVVLQVYGDDGNDLLNGGNANDTIYGDDGNDTFRPTSSLTDGDDVFYGGAGTDLADYSGRGTEDTWIMFGALMGSGHFTEADTLQNDVENGKGGAGNDYLWGSTATTVDNVLWGGSGNDQLRGGRGNDTMYGEGGNDSFDETQGFPNSGNDDLRGGAGTDKANYNRLVALTITMGDETANDGASGEKDNVRNDVEDLDADGGDLNITGNALANKFNTLSGNDTVNGGDGNDSMYLSGGNDTFNGGNGNDTFNDQLGITADVFSGGAGTDRVLYNRTFPGAITATIDDPNTITDGEGGENDFIKTDVEDILGHGSSVNILTGSAGNNYLQGGTAVDTLIGGDGADVLDGGTEGGVDTLDCGNGGDVCADPDDCASASNCEL